MPISTVLRIGIGRFWPLGHDGMWPEAEMALQALAGPGKHTMNPSRRSRVHGGGYGRRV